MRSNLFIELEFQIGPSSVGASYIFYPSRKLPRSEDASLPALRP